MRRRGDEGAAILDRRRNTSAPAERAGRGVLSFGALLRRYRLAAGLTQLGLAERAGLSLRAINALESGHHRAPREQTLTLLASALGLDPNERAALIAAALRRPHAAHALVLLPAPTPPTADALPAIKPPNGSKQNLPLQPTPLLGRERELDELTALLLSDETRLVTLTGMGGAGKTRLALAAAQASLDAGAFPDGVWLARLAPLTEPAQIIPAVAQALGLSETGATPVEQTLRAYLRDRDLLLLLDNFEHLAAAAPQVAELLEWSPGLTIMVTSRAALRLRGERRVPVALLPFPPRASRQPITAALLDDYPATALFVQRARAAHPGFAATDANAPAVAAICARLDGLPLAIELAAAWTRLLSPAALLERVERQPELLAGGPLDLPERQRALRATITWSYDLLAPEEQRLFRRLAVFADDCDPDAAEAICGVPLSAPPLRLNVLVGLGKLLDQSLIVQRLGGGEQRVAMLHVVREFALDLLEESGEAQALRHTHARYFSDLAGWAEPELRGPELTTWLIILERELPNLRAALGWARSSGEEGAITLGLRLATALWRFWFEGGYLSEGQQWVEALLALADATHLSLPAGLRARAYATAGILAAARRDAARAASHLEQAIALGRAADDWLALAIGLEMSGALLRLRGDLDGAERRFAEALAVGRDHGDALATYTPLASLGEVARQRGDPAQAAARFSEAMAVSRAAGHLNHVSLMLRRLAELALARDENARAATLLRESAALLYTHGKRWALTHIFELLAVALARLGHNERAARLLGGAARLRESGDFPYALAEEAAIEALVAASRVTLSAEPWAPAFAAGRARSLEETYAETQRDLPSPAGAEVAPALPQPPAPPSRARADILTRRELEVLRLLAEGWTDAQIAQRLVISPRTVNHHVTAIYGKLGVSSRAAATRSALDNHLL